MRLRSFLLSLSMIMLAPISGYTAAPAQLLEKKDALVEIQNFQFLPAQVTVPPGTRVTWVNKDDEPHIVVSAGNQFQSSPALDTDDKYSTVFSKPGTYTYFCSIHPHMVGTIVVK